MGVAILVCKARRQFSNNSMGASFLSSRSRNSLRSARLMEVVWEECESLDPGHP